MNKHIAIEIALGVTIIVCLCFIGVDQYRKAVDNAKAEAKADALRESQQQTDGALKARDAQYQSQLQQLEDKYKALAKMTPQQIVQKAPEYIAIPKPIVISGPETSSVPVGTALVPPEDIQPLAHAILDGGRCTVDLEKCTGDLGDWQQKYDLKNEESQQWEKAAKGGSWLKRLGKNVMKVGIGVGVGYALHR